MSNVVVLRTAGAMACAEMQQITIHLSSARKERLCGTNEAMGRTTTGIVTGSRPWKKLCIARINRHVKAEC
jgi:hypothetical protein